VASILIDGIPFNAFAHLEHAIDCAMAYWQTVAADQTEDELHIWADQVCINQKDTAERSSQVAMMGEIYHHSRECLICLSTNDEDEERPTILQEIAGFLPQKGQIQESMWGSIEKSDGAAAAWLQNLSHVVGAPWWSRA